MRILDWNPINNNNLSIALVVIIINAAPILMASESIVSIYLLPENKNINNNNNSAYAQSATPQGVYNNGSSGSANSTLYAIGTAQISVEPDKVTLSLAVETTNKTAEEALTANSEAINKTLAALQTAGVKENETSTTLFTISPNYNFTTRNITGYTVVNSIDVESSDLTKLSKWIDSAVLAGANTVNNIDFSLSDKKLEETENMLLKEAIGNAKDKADITASVLGLEVMGVKSINVNIGYLPPPEPFLRQGVVGTAQSTAETADTPIISGKQQVSTSVDVVFIIG
jgi:uncharacterized protein YggE